MRPHELLEAAAASSMTITARMAADELGIPVDDIRVVVDLERGATRAIFPDELRLPGTLSQVQIMTLNGRIRSSPVLRTLSAELAFEPTSAGETFSTPAAATVDADRSAPRKKMR